MTSIEEVLAQLGSVEAQIAEATGVCASVSSKFHDAVASCGAARSAGINAFVDEARHDYRNAEPELNVLILEAMIRAIYGEEHLVDHVPSDDQLMVQAPAIRKIVLQSQEMQDRLDDYLADAETLAKAWSEED